VYFSDRCSFLIPRHYSLGLDNVPESSKRLHLFRVPVGSLAMMAIPEVALSHIQSV
jgi:hypothetical protein